MGCRTIASLCCQAASFLCVRVCDTSGCLAWRKPRSNGCKKTPFLQCVKACVSSGHLTQKKSHHNGSRKMNFLPFEMFGETENFLNYTNSNHKKSKQMIDSLGETFNVFLSIKRWSFPFSLTNVLIVQIFTRYCRPESLFMLVHIS